MGVTSSGVTVVQRAAAAAAAATAAAAAADDYDRTLESINRRHSSLAASIGV